MDETEAITRLKRGDIGGLEVLVRRYQLQALRAVYLITHNRPLAEDLVQAAFLRAYERIDQFDSSRSFGPWFLRSVVNDAIKVAARNERYASPGDIHEASTLMAGLVDPNAGPELALERAETGEEVRAALARLTPGQRAAVVLRYYLDLSEAEIADRLGCPQGTVKRRLHDARARLREILGHVLPSRIGQPIVSEPVQADARSEVPPRLKEVGGEG